MCRIHFTIQDPEQLHRITHMENPPEFVQLFNAFPDYRREELCLEWEIWGWAYSTPAPTTTPTPTPLTPHMATTEAIMDNALYIHVPWMLNQASFFFSI